MVCINAFFLKMPRSSLSSFTVIPVRQERKAGYKGNAQGDKNDKKPAPNARNKLICSNNNSQPLINIKYDYHKDKI